MIHVFPKKRKKKYGFRTKFRCHQTGPDPHDLLSTHKEDRSHTSTQTGSAQAYMASQAKLEFFFVLNAQIGLHEDRNGESTDWQGGVPFFCCLSLPCEWESKSWQPLSDFWMRTSEHIDSRALCSSSHLLQPVVYMLILDFVTPDSLSVVLLVLHSGLHIKLDSYSVWHKCHLWWSFVWSICKNTILAKFSSTAKVCWSWNLLHCGFWGTTGPRQN